MNKTVSVVLCAYHENEHDLRMAINSIINQSYRNIELIIVVDDPNNTDLQNILDEYAISDSRITILINDKNYGPAYSRNRGILASHGDYIAIMDADDVSLENRIDEQLEFLLKNDIDVVFSERITIDENDNIIESRVRSINDEYIPLILKHGNIITNSTGMFSRSIIVDNDLYYRDIPYGEDYDLWLRFCSNNIRMHIIPKPLVKYRIRNGSLSHTNFCRTWVATKYVKQLYSERQRTIKDSFSKNNYSQYICNSVLSDQCKMEEFNMAYDYYMRCIFCIKNKQLTKGLIAFANAIRNIEIVAIIYNSIMTQFWLRRAQNKHNNYSFGRI